MIKLTGMLKGSERGGRTEPAEVFLSRELGEFDHLHGAKYLSPPHINARFPELVELHETIHQTLAVNNFTDGICRLFSLILEYGRSELRLVDRWRIERLLEAAHAESVFAHEVTANYYSFLLFAVRHPGSAAEARKDLPPGYEALLCAGEAAFGAISDPRTIENSIKILWVVPWIAIAALNLDYNFDTLRFSSLGKCRRFIRANSPDRRYRRLLQSLRPHWDCAGILSNLISAWDGSHPEQLQEKVHANLRRNQPDLLFQATTARPKYLREAFEVIENSAAERRYQFFDGLREMAQSPDAGKVTPFYGASVLLPGLPVGATPDYTINSLDYISVTPAAITKSAELLRGSSIFLALLVMRGAPADPENTAFVLGYPTRAGGSLMGPPFQLTAPVNQLANLLRKVTPGLLVIKIDERDSILQQKLEVTGHWIVTLLAVTAYGHVLEVLRRIADADSVEVFFLDLSPEREYVAIVMKPKGRRVCYAAPATKLGRNAVAHEAGRSEKITLQDVSQPSSFGGFAASVFKVVSHCYLGLLQDYCLLTRDNRS
jgi:hypothetical protein